MLYDIIAKVNKILDICSYGPCLVGVTGLKHAIIPLTVIMSLAKICRACKTSSVEVCKDLNNYRRE